MKKIGLFFLILLLTLAPSASVRADEAESHSKLILLLEKSNHFYASVKNYSALFQKQETSQGVAGPKEKIFLKFEKPFKIFMGWLNTEKKGLQVVYERGRHGGKLAIHKPGLGLGLLPVIFLDQKSPWVREGSQSYDIEDAGIGTFLTDFTEDLTRASAVHQVKVQFLEPLLPNQEETAEVIFEGSDKNSGYMAYRVIVSFEPKTALPVKMRLFDWDNQLMGEYAYENLKINAASDDVEFKQQINRQLYRVYQGK